MIGSGLVSNMDISSVTFMLRVKLQLIEINVYLATRINFSDLHFDFLMGVSTIGKIIRKTCEVLWTKAFYSKTQFPNYVGAVDGKHIRLKCPPRSDVGSYGKENDCNIFKKSLFGKKLYANKINFPEPQCLPEDDGGTPQPYVLGADEAFALNTNLLRSFPGRSLNNERQPDFGVGITKACCILHNFVRRRDGYCLEDAQTCDMEDTNERIGVGNSTSVAKEVRDYFANYFNKPMNALSWQNKEATKLLDLLRTIIGKLNSDLEKLQQKTKTLSDASINEIMSSKNLSAPQTVLTCEIIKTSKNQNKKNSSSTYVLLREQDILPLPCPCTIRNLEDFGGKVPTTGLKANHGLIFLFQRFADNFT
ncbi:protein ALP1-like [Aphis craccivora]|uniref:Protein ALP1-like n=1 Tax=Aphis craccivora TaxID=307492 RepID=A0A6G0Y1H4_APHCR|nr:protein ALP1-like [Aphis craccivora]